MFWFINVTKKIDDVFPNNPVFVFVFNQILKFFKNCRCTFWHVNVTKCFEIGTLALQKKLTFNFLKNPFFCDPSPKTSSEIVVFIFWRINVTKYFEIGTFALQKN